MKRVITFLFALLMAFALVACGRSDSNSPQNPDTQQGAPSEQPVPENTATPQKEQITGDIEFISCRFADAVHAADGEYTAMLYQQLEGYVYVDAVFSVDNNTSEEISEEQISGWVTYQDTKMPLEYCKDNSVSTAVEDDPVFPDEQAYVHLFTRLPAEAEQESLTLHYAVNGKEYECDVFPKDTRDALAVKTEVRQGDVVNVPYTSYTFQVLEAGIKENLQASNQESYYSGPFAIVKLQVTNEHSTRMLEDILGYTENNGELYRFSTEVEINEGTEFEPLNYEGIAPGESKTVYIFAKITDDLDSNHLVVRFNVAGTCYYAEVQ